MKSSQPLALAFRAGGFCLRPDAVHHVAAHVVPMAPAISLQRGNRLAQCRAQCRGMQVESGQKNAVAGLPTYYRKIC